MTAVNPETISAQGEKPPWPWNRYEKEIERTSEWHRTWASYYWNRGGISIAFAAKEVVPITFLSCPIVKIITYLALRYFQDTPQNLFKRATNEKNTRAAELVPKWGVTRASLEQDLFNTFAQKKTCLSSQDLETCTTLLQNGAKTNRSEHDFSQMLQKALEEKKDDLVMLLLTQDVTIDSCDSWTNHLPNPSEDVMPLPDWSRPLLYSSPSFGIDDLNEAASKSLPSSHSTENGHSQQFMRIFNLQSRHSPLILGESEEERKSLVQEFTRQILSGEVPDKLKKKRVIGIDLAKFTNLNQLSDVRSLMNAYTKILNDYPSVIFYVHNFEAVDGSPLLKVPYRDIKQHLTDWAQTGRTIFSMSPSTYDSLNFAKDLPMQTVFTPFTVLKPSAKECLPLLEKQKTTLEIYHQTLFTHQALKDAISMTSIHLKDYHFPKTPYEVLDIAAALWKEQDIQGSFKCQKEKERRRKLSLDLEKKPTSEKMDILEEIEKQNQRIEELEEKDRQDNKHKKEYLELNFLKAYLNSPGPKASPLSPPLLEKVNARLNMLEEIKKSAHIKFEIDQECIARAIAAKTGLPLNQIKKDQDVSVHQLAEKLGEDVIGQERAVQGTADVVMQAEFGFKEEKKPIVLLYTGPSGVGKTQLAKSLANHLFNSDESVDPPLTPFNMAQHTHESDHTYFFGAPPGYIRSDEKGELFKAFDKKGPKQVVLLDEFEKCDEKVRQTFLQAFDEGFFKNSHGDQVDCSRAIFILTSNLGAKEVNEQMAQNERMRSLQKIEKSAPQTWLTNRLMNRPSHSDWQPITEDDMIETLKKSVQKSFPSELCGRINEVFGFLPLRGDDMIKQLIEKVLKDLTVKTMADRGMTLTWTQKAISQLAYETRIQESGARALQGIISKKINTPLAYKLACGKIKRDDHIELDYNDNDQKYTFNLVTANPSA